MKIFSLLAIMALLGLAAGCGQLDPNRTSSSNPNAVHTAVKGPLQIPANVGTAGVTGRTHVP